MDRELKTQNSWCPLIRYNELGAYQYQKPSDANSIYFSFHSNQKEPVSM
jgi:hypothetical protein